MYSTCTMLVFNRLQIIIVIYLSLFLRLALCSGIITPDKDQGDTGDLMWFKCVYRKCLILYAISSAPELLFHKKKSHWMSSNRNFAFTTQISLFYYGWISFDSSSLRNTSPVTWACLNNLPENIEFSNSSARK